MYGFTVCGFDNAELPDKLSLGPECTYYFLGSTYKIGRYLKFRSYIKFPLYNLKH